MTHQEMVREFCQMIGAPTRTPPSLPRFRDEELRARLVLEEAVETAVALVGRERLRALVEHAVSKAKGERDLVDAIDGVCDLVYVALGTAEALDFDLAPHFAEVHRANMQKVNVPVDEHGKRGQKPDGWRPPDHLGVLGALNPRVSAILRVDEIRALRR